MSVIIDGRLFLVAMSGEISLSLMGDPTESAKARKINLLLRLAILSMIVA